MVLSRDGDVKNYILILVLYNRFVRDDYLESILRWADIRI